MGDLTPELARYHEEIRELAKGYGLDFYETIFELVDSDELNMIASYGGFPRRYPHWRFGMEYDQLSKSYQHGLSKIYELVINNDPCYAYLMRSNSLLEQKLVMAHVYGHCDFFKNNYWFSKTDRKMMDTMANHGTRIRAYMDRYGVAVVEDFIDRVNSLENLIDPCSELVEGSVQAEVDSDDAELPLAPRADRDVLRFLMRFAPLEPWQQDVLAMLRDEAYYFVPQRMTTVMNEGWAVYWHSTMMCKHILRPEELITYCGHHSGALATVPGQINPYKLGVELMRHIERRWDKGQYGREWASIEDAQERRNYDNAAGKGREKIFELRRDHNDVSFVEQFFDEDFARDQKYYVYGRDSRSGEYVIVDRDYRKVKQQLLWGLTNFGQPRISVIDANYANRGELYLYHEWRGLDLQFQLASETLKNLHALWQRPVHLETREEGEGRLLSFDGEELRFLRLRPSEEAFAVGQLPPDGDENLEVTP
ncbi:MAG: SpoVR family protein [Planctomycetota bacterium]|nr:MAG: SpoVR family protein [Planctomycetota bacterium]